MTDWIFKSYRVGTRGEYYGSAERGDEWITTERFSGRGAKARALAAIKQAIAELERRTAEACRADGAGAGGGRGNRGMSDTRTMIVHNRVTLATERSVPAVCIGPGVFVAHSSDAVGIGGAVVSIAPDPTLRYVNRVDHEPHSDSVMIYTDGGR